MISLSNENSIIHHGKKSPTGAVLNVQDTPVGKYILRIYEPTMHQSAFLGCSDFSLSIFIDEAKDNNLRDKTPGIPLPAHLDGIEHLRYMDSIHLQNEYAVPVAIMGVPFKGANLSFQLKKPSVVRFSAGFLDPITIQVKTVTDYPDKDLVLSLGIGKYEVNFQSTAMISSPYLVFNLQVSIKPIPEVLEMAHHVCSQLRPILNPPNITVRPTDGLYLFREYGRIPLNGFSFPILVPFEVQRESVVSVQVAYQHIIGRLVTGLQGTKPSTC